MRPAVKRALFLLLALFCLVSACLFWCYSTGKGLSTGRYLAGRDGSHILIDERGSPIVLSDRTSGQTLFNGLEDGDRLLVLHDGVAETYPARSGAYFCLRLEVGSDADLPADTLVSLAELGWLIT